MLNITKRLENDTTVYQLEGRLDTVTSPDLTKELAGTLGGVQKLVFDFEKLSYISSAGLRVLLATQKELMGRGEMKVIHVNEVIMEVFEITGFTEILTIE